MELKVESEEANIESMGDITFSNGKLIANNTAFEVTESTSDTKSNDAVTLLQETADSYELILNKSSSTPIFIHQNYETMTTRTVSLNHVTKNTQVAIVEVVGELISVFTVVLLS